MRRLNLELSEEAYQTLEALKKQLGKPSKAEVLRSAIALLVLSQNEQLCVISGERIEKLKIG